MTEKPTVFDVRIERDEDGWWVATVADIPGCHTQARTLREARSRIRKAVAASIDNPPAVSVYYFTLVAPDATASALQALLSEYEIEDLREMLVEEAVRRAKTANIFYTVPGFRDGEG